MTYLRINVAALGARLVRGGVRQPMTNGDVMTWLVDNGFRVVRGGWTAGAPQLRRLRQNEIIVSHSIGDAPEKS